MPNMIFGNDVVVGDSQQIGILVQIDDLLGHHKRACRQLGLHRNVRILLLEVGADFLERHRQRTGGEYR